MADAGFDPSARNDAHRLPGRGCHTTCVQGKEPVGGTVRTCPLCNLGRFVSKGGSKQGACGHASRRSLRSLLSMRLPLRQHSMKAGTSLCCRSGELQGRDAVAALEMLGERALVVEADVGRDLGDRSRMPEMPAGDVEADLGQVGMRREPCRALEQADELESRQADILCQIFQSKVFRIVSAHALLHTLQHDLVARRRGDPGAVAAMAPEQSTEGADQKLAFLEDIAALFDGAMHGEEAVDEIGIEEYVPREVGYLLDAKAVRHLIERRLGEVERAIPPALAPAHPAGVGLCRIEDKQRGGMRLL